MSTGSLWTPSSDICIRLFFDAGFEIYHHHIETEHTKQTNPQLYLVESNEVFVTNQFQRFFHSPISYAAEPARSCEILKLDYCN